LKNEDHLHEVIALPMADGLHVVKVQILCIVKQTGTIHTSILRTRRRYLCQKQLKEFELLLAQNGFCRIHHSALINLRYINKYVRGEGGYVIMKDGTEIESVPPERKKSF